jgi:hypothetical protein
LIKKISMVVCFIIISMLVFLVSQSTPVTSIQINEKIKYLSYIPPIDIVGKEETLYAVSLEKIDFFKDDQLLDEFASLERFQPIIDKVIYIPDGFHENASLDFKNRTGKIG